MIFAGTNLSVITRKPLSGGCIGQVEYLNCHEGEFVYKRYSRSGIAEAEAEGLRCIVQTDSIKVPTVISATDSELLMTYIKPGRSTNIQKNLGMSLAQLHQNSTSDKYGFYSDNWLGETVQKNDWKENWTDFFIENRYLFQIELLRKRGLLSTEMKELSQKVLKTIPDLLEESQEAPCLIHGDLWSGNYFSDETGSAVIIDPAVSYCHREMELGMLELFGNVASEFYRAYESVYPLQSGWKQRVKLYVLYHLLNHFNLFGRSYEGQCASLMNEISNVQ